MTIKREHLIRAISSLYKPFSIGSSHSRRAHPESGRVISDIGNRLQNLVTEEVWNTIEWPGTLITKPTWRTLVVLSKIAATYNKMAGLEHTLEVYVNLYSREPIKHDISEDKILIGIDGVDHISSLIHHHAETLRAGYEWPITILKGKSGKQIEFWTEEEVLPILNGMTAKKNNATSATNILQLKLEAYNTIAQDENGGLDSSATDEEKLRAREIAAEKMIAIFANFENAFFDALDEVEEYKNRLPDDVNRARNKLRTRISAAANRKRNLILDIVAASEAYLPPACIEQVKAQEEVSMLRQAGMQQLRALTTVTEMKAAADKVIEKFDAIPVINAPIWLTTERDAIPGPIVDVPLSWDVSASKPRTIALFGTRPPYDLEGDRTLAQLGDITVFFDPTFRPIGDWGLRTIKYTGNVPEKKGIYDVSLQWRGDAPPAIGTVIPIISRNNCGPTLLKVRIVEPSDD